MVTNTPVLLQGAAADWPARASWCRDDGSVDLDAIVALFGASTVVPVTDVITGECDAMQLGAYVEWWRQYTIAAMHKGQENEGDDTHGDMSKKLLYAKDWHLHGAFDNMQAVQAAVYSTPAHFQDDWLNQQCDQQGTEDYRFIYMGPQGTWNILHADVLRSYSWSANVAGIKRWLLVPPSLTPLLYDPSGRTMARALPDPYVFSAKGVHGGMRQAAEEAQQWPGPRALMEAGLVLCVMQEPGDALFVPSGWHHVVCNVTDAVSINHNWLNGYNIQWVVRHIQTEIREACTAIADCRALCESEGEFHALVYRNAGINAGYDVEQLAELLVEHGVCGDAQQALAIVSGVFKD